MWAISQCGMNSTLWSYEGSTTQIYKKIKIQVPNDINGGKWDTYLFKSAAPSHHLNNLLNSAIRTLSHPIEALLHSQDLHYIQTMRLLLSYLNSTSWVFSKASDTNPGLLKGRKMQTADWGQQNPQREYVSIQHQHIWQHDSLDP